MNQTSKRRKLPKTVKELEVQIALGVFEVDDVFKTLRCKTTSGDVIEILYTFPIGELEEEWVGPSNYSWERNQRNEMVSKHPNTPASVLTSIFQQRKFMENPNNVNSCDAHILYHPSFPAELLREIINKIDYDSQFNTRGEWSNIFEAIKNPNIPAEFLKTLSTHTNICVRTLVAKHNNTPPKVLEQLSTDKGHYRYTKPNEQVAANKSAPAYLLTTLSKSTNVKIRKRVANNPSTPTDTLKAMISKDRSPSIKSTALYTLFNRGQVKFVVD